jgi:threonine/homoserine/homoserine lactone efflux protein
MVIPSGSFLVFVGIAILVIVTPGPDTALTIRNALLGGRSAGVFTALGVATGQMTWALATSAGLVTILIASEPIFYAVKLAGAAYLIGLGGQSLLAAFRSGSRAREIEGRVRVRLWPPVAFRQGIVNNLGNPKMAVFFVSVLPQFEPRHEGMFAASVLLGMTLAALTLVWLIVYALAVSAVGSFLQRRHVRRAIETATGAVLIGLGVRVALEARR